MASPLPEPVAPTLTLGDASRHPWQVVVVGAGPAGSIAARELSRRGVEVLLVEKAAFPRFKVCGGCLGPVALGLLEECDLGHVVNELGAARTTALRVVGRTGSASLQLPVGAAVSRKALDAALVREAIAEGVDFLDRTTVRLAGADAGAGVRHLRLRSGSRTVDGVARMVLAADGLAGSLLARDPELQPEVAADSRIGVGALLEIGPCGDEPGVITMSCAGPGYVGLVRVERGHLNVAAALEAAFIRESGGPAEAVRNHLAALGIHLPHDPDDATWSGTPALTRKRLRLWGERLLVIGDAAGYVEPFTGEGMAWAMLSGRAVAPFAQRGVGDWTAELGWQWESRHRRVIQHRQWICRIIANLSRHPGLAEAVIRLCGRFPLIARPVIRRVSRRDTGRRLCRKNP